VFDTLFPSHNLKRLNEPVETITAIDPLEGAPAATQAPAATEAPAVNVPAATDAPTPEPTDAPAVVG